MRDCLPPHEPAPHAGRYHVAGGPWPLYGALDEPTVWAEWARATSGGVRPEDDPRSLCRFTVDLQLIDLRDPRVRNALGVTIEALVADWTDSSPNQACLIVARRAAELGADGFVVPSAARSGAWCIHVMPSAFPKLRTARRRAAIPAPPPDVAL